MSKRLEGDGVDETSSASVSNPLVHESSDEKNQGKASEMGPLQEQSQDSDPSQQDGIRSAVEVSSSSILSDDSDEADPLSSSHGPTDSPSSSEQNNDLEQRKRQLPLQLGGIHSAANSEAVETQDGGGMTPIESTSANPPHNQLISNEKLHNSGTKNVAVAQDDSDQEVPLTDDLDGKPTITWKPQNEQSLCEFTHTIKDYSQKRDSGCKKAEYSDVTVDDRGNKWRLIVYVNGNGRASNHHLSLFLQVADADDLPFGWKKAVSYVLTLEHPEGGGLSYAKRNPDKTFKMCPKAIDWGWSQFITSDKIQQEGFLHDDSLVVRASVTVKSSSVTIDADDAELYLKCAVEEGKPDAVQLCLDQGASVNCQFKDDLYTPLHTACSVSPAEQDNGEDESSKSALSSTASVEGSMKVLELLLKEGADGNACNKWKETPLLIAANNGHKNAVEALLRFGANPALCSEAGWSALTFAAHKGYDEIVALLLNADAPINCRVAEDESTPLHKACAGSKSGHLEAVKLLLDGGADVHALNKWRETPLLTAANHGQAGAVEALLRAGADPCKCTDTGWSPLSIAAYKGHNDVVKLLLDEGAPTEEADPTLSALLQAATKGLPDTVELLLRHGADHTVTTKKGDTALSILVEQNLIDAAVEMVTRYKASIPRCSRDRKKVQKARLLINLRVKQQQKDAKDAPHDLYHDDDDYSQDDLVDEGQNSKTDVIHGAQGTNKIAKMKNNNNNNNGKVSAEEQAKAAEEALLMELELEDAERNKQEKEANKKLAKKRKKKERERQLKKEQEEKRLAEERAEEEKRRQELHARELAEKAERDRAAAARKKQEQEYLRKQSEDLRNRQKEEERIKKLKKEEEARSSKALPKANSAVSTTPNGRKPRQESRNEDRAKASIPKGHSPQSQNSTTPRNISDRANPAVERKKRGWESLPSTATASKSSPTGAKNSETIGTSVVATVASESGATPDRARESLDGKDAPAPSKSGAGTTRADGTSRDDVLTFLEPPAVTVFRREKVFELLHRCSLAHLSNDALGCVDDTILRIVLLRWIDRSAHDDSECFDMIIPSWKDSEKLISFFQRQFITESRRGVTNRTIPSMESLKEAGATMASYCQSLARSVHDFRHQAEKQLSLNWNDESVGMSCSEIVRTMGNPTVIIDWSKQSQIQLPTSVFLNLKQRYRGSPSRFLASTFVCKYLHDTIFLLGGEAPVDYKLLPATKEILSMQMGIDAEVWADPFSVTGSNRLWSRLRSIDQLFGGCEPFTFSDVNDHVLRVRGGSVLLLVPSDNMIASRYIRHAVDALLSGSSTALSFTIFLRPDCLIDGSSSVTVEHLYALDPRLTKHQHLISRVERLPPGRHAFFSEKLGSPRASSTGDLFVVLQNMMGKTRYPVSDIAVAQILDSMKYEVDRQFEPSMRAPVPFSMSAGTYKPNVHLWTPQSDFITAPSAALIPPSPLPHQTIGSIGAAESNYQTIHSSISDSFPSNNSPTGQRRSAPRRGRLFDLVDDGGDEDNMNDVVSGMLGTLNVDLFQSTGVQDVDIEAISLMGIGGSTTQSSPSTLNPRGSSSQGRFG